LRSKWKLSTASTTENRIRYHLLSEFNQTKLCDLTLIVLQVFLNTKAETHSRSVVAHLRWDLRSVFKLCRSEKKWALPQFWCALTAGDYVLWHLVDDKGVRGPAGD
jgi:hypothetical protein